MIITCGACDQKFNVNFDKLDLDSVTFKCKSCGETIKARRSASASFAPDQAPLSSFELETLKKPDLVETESEYGLKDQSTEAHLENKLEIKGVSIRTKITLIIVALAAFSLAIAGVIASYQSR